MKSRQSTLSKSYKWFWNPQTHFHFFSGPRHQRSKRENLNAKLRELESFLRAIRDFRLRPGTRSISLRHFLSPRPQCVSEGPGTCWDTLPFSHLSLPVSYCAEWQTLDYTHVKLPLAPLGSRSRRLKGEAITILEPMISLTSAQYARARQRYRDGADRRLRMCACQ